jgi:hypothetical protein
VEISGVIKKLKNFSHFEKNIFKYATGLLFLIFISSLTLTGMVLYLISPAFKPNAKADIEDSSEIISMYTPEEALVATPTPEPTSTPFPTQTPIPSPSPILSPKETQKFNTTPTPALYRPKSKCKGYRVMCMDGTCTNSRKACLDNGGVRLWLK